MNRIIYSIIGVALAGSVCLTGCQMSGQKEEPRNYLSEVKSVNKLVLAQMTISKMATIDDIDLSKAEGLKQTAAGVP